MSATETIPINDPKEIRGWVMYDWANSAFTTTVVTALMGPYMLALAEQSSIPFRLFGSEIQPAAIYPFSVSISVLLQVLVLPLLGTMADFTPYKKRMLLALATVGGIAASFLFFVGADFLGFSANGNVVLGSTLFMIANLCFGASIMLYNSASALLNA